MGQTSQNGWPASADGSSIGIKTYNLKLKNGAKTVQLAAAAAPSLLAMIEWWDRNIEPVSQLGGYNFREIRGYEGTGIISNHGSGTAIDINWDKHPLAASGTVSATQAEAIRKRASELGLRWGGDYKGRKDEMHFEVKSGFDLSLAKLNEDMPILLPVVVSGSFAVVGATLGDSFGSTRRHRASGALLGMAVGAGVYYWLWRR